MPQNVAKPVLGQVHHVALAVKDLKSATDFYQDVLGLSSLATPPEARANGIQWLDIGHGLALHLIEVPDVTAPPRTHIAISVSDNDAWRTYITSKNIAITEPTVDLYAAKRFFIQDPTGNLVELVEWLS